MGLISRNDYSSLVAHRVCPGVHLADATAFLILSTIMSVFDIKPVPGSSIPTSFEYTDGGIR